jgi:pSer/pThr/pTyr-binding forkhead associated (FHA) protein
MPITVVVRGARGEAPSLTFDGGRIVIGRSDGSDVRLPDPSVSLRHASIRTQGAEYTLVDEGSTNGTWVGDIKLTPQTPRLVKTGDQIRVGRVWLEVIIGARAPTPDLGLATRDLALALVRSAMEAVGDDTQPVVFVAEGPDIGTELRLAEQGRSYVIGRGAHCDLLLADEDASREHLVVVRRRAHVTLRDLSSHNGVYLGDVRIAPDKDLAWRSPLMVRVGRSVLRLEEPVTQALAQLEAVADEALPDEAAPPPPPSAHAPSAPPPAPAAAPPPESQRAVAAPIAEVASRTAPTVPRARQRRVWTFADVMLVTIAVVVIGLSLAALVWVLK